MMESLVTSRFAWGFGVGTALASASNSSKKLDVAWPNTMSLVLPVAGIPWLVTADWGVRAASPPLSAPPATAVVAAVAVAAAPAGDVPTAAWAATRAALAAAYGSRCDCKAGKRKGLPITSLNPSSAS